MTSSQSHRSGASASQTNLASEREPSLSDGPEPSSTSSPDPISLDLAAELHAATLAVVLHTQSHELKRSCASYWTRVMACYYRDEAMARRLRCHLHAVQRRAREQAEALGGGLIAQGLPDLVQGTRDDDPIDLEW